ncbi:ribosome recycling factor [Candidatus Woesebacteria bacterium]|nr:ribosome recycling factor [Candidatus Woesebacteria bacterium]
MSDALHSFQQLSQKAFEHVQQEVRTLRTGRASADILDPVRVEAYGSSMRLVEVASVTAPDATLLVVSPWDKSLVGAVEKAIASAGLNLNPVVEGQIIRIAVPPLTQERRQEMVKLLHQKVEAGRATLRTIRTDTKQEIENQKGAAGVSEDDIESELSQLDEAVKTSLARLEELQTQKETELLRV